MRLALELLALFVVGALIGSALTWAYVDAERDALELELHAERRAYANAVRLLNASAGDLAEWMRLTEVAEREAVELRADVETLRGMLVVVLEQRDRATRELEKRGGR